MLLESYTGGEQLQIWYEGPPSVSSDPESGQGEQFFLSGDYKGHQGVELARGLTGLFRAPRDYRYDTSANQPGSTFVDYVANRRRFDGAINILADKPSEFMRAARNWLRNHPANLEGKLWIHGPNTSKRYAFVRATADSGISAMDFDPQLTSSLVDFPWSWESDYPYLFGEDVTTTFSTSGRASIRNLSTAGTVYPRLFLPGPGVYKFGKITTPRLAAHETIRINFDPERQTYTKRDEQTGKVTNLWYTVLGERPKFSLEPGEAKEFLLTMPSTESTPYFKHTPLFEGAF